MDAREVTLNVDTGGNSQVVAISGTSAQSAVLTSPDTNLNKSTLDVVCTPTVDCFVRQGSNPTALATGVDIFLVGGNTYRLSGILSGNKLAFKTGGATGNVYITPSA